MSSPLARQIMVTLAAVICAVGTLVGTGVIGTRVAESSGGSLAADSTLIAPGGPAFAIWSVIYLGLAMYTVVQWFPRYAHTERHRATAWLAAASMVLNALWLLVTQAGWITASVGVIGALLWTCATIVQRLGDLPERIGVFSNVSDGVFGLYLGWVCVAVCANIAAALVAWGVPATGAAATIATVVVLLVVVAVTALLTARLGRNPWIGVAVVWGVSWIAVARLTDAPRSMAVGITAIVVAVVAAALTGWGFRRSARSVRTPSTLPG